MVDVTATEAARNFSDLLDAVERGEEFRIIRRGRPVAQLEPAPRALGALAKTVLTQHEVDADCADDIRAMRRLISLEERP